MVYNSRFEGAQSFWLRASKNHGLLVGLYPSNVYCNQKLANWGNCQLCTWLSEWRCSVSCSQTVSTKWWNTDMTCFGRYRTKPMCWVSSSMLLLFIFQNIHTRTTSTTYMPCLCLSSRQASTSYPGSGRKSNPWIRGGATMDGLIGPCPERDFCFQIPWKCQSPLISAAMATTKQGPGWSHRIFFIFLAWLISKASQIFMAKWPQKLWRHLCWRRGKSWPTLHVRDVQRAWTTLPQLFTAKRAFRQIVSLGAPD